jgi:alanine racemase
VTLPDLSECRATRAEVHLDALEANLASIRARVEGRPILGVVKADAYGHGAVVVAQSLQAAGIDRFAVALLEEALELRRAGITVPILVMGAVEPPQMERLMRDEITPALFREDQLDALDAEAARFGRTQPVHLKVDTGMGRLGIPFREVGSFAGKIRKRPRLVLEGVFSHLACADEPDHPLTALQIERMGEVIQALRSEGFDPPLRHLANSAAVLDRPPAYLSLVRPGLLLYGVKPSPRNQGLDLRPVLRFVSRVISVKEVAAGDTVGYGASFTAARAGRIATVAAGYDDGVIRSLSNRGHFLVREKRLPIAGRVSMDLTALDATDHPEVRLGDEAVLIGSQGGAFQGAETVAEEAGTISWEIFCGIGPRVPRCYLRGDRIVAIRSRFAPPSGTA